MKVLIADDDKSVRNSLRKVLEEADYDVLLASNGEEALKVFEGENVDLLLLDIGLPAKSGWDIFERITTEHPTLPIIIITGQTGQFEVATAAGVGALMEKPLDAPMLLRTIGELLAESKEMRLRRLCGYKRTTRFVMSASTLFLRELRERYSAPMRSTLMNKVYL